MRFRDDSLKRKKKKGRTCMDRANIESCLFLFLLKTPTHHTRTHTHTHQDAHTETHTEI